MLVRRFVEHVREQDWFLVGVEIMIVVVGIFIALQADGWNQERKDIALERQYLARMQSEFEDLLEVEESRLRWNDARLAQGALIQKVIDNQHLPDDERQAFEYGLYLLGAVNRARLSWGTVEELRSTGNIQLIRDWSLREHITNVENDYKWNERLESEYAEIALHYRQELNKHYRIMKGHQAHEGHLVDLEIEYDESDFWSDPTLANMIASLIDYQNRTNVHMRENLSRLEALRDHIADVRKLQFGDE
jgi:hypothetical protein